MKTKILSVLLVFAICINASAQNDSETPIWTGSGFAISDRYIATNFHVVDGAKKLKISGVNGNFTTSYTTSVVATDANNDLAILKISDEQFLGFRNIPYTIYPTNVDVGTDVFVLGYPATIIMGQEVKITTGIINSRSGFQGDVSTYQMSATIQGGNSGGPVFDNDGNVIAIAVGGINREILQNIENVNYSVKSPYLINLIESCSESIIIPSSSKLNGLSLPARIKQISPFVVQITAYDDASNTSTSNIAPQSSGNKERSDLLYERALEAMKKGNKESAYSDLNTAIRLHPTAEKYYLLGLLAFDFASDTTTNNHFKEDTSIAITSFEYCVNAKYRLKDCTHWLAHCYYISGRYLDAIALYDRLLKEDKRDVVAFLGRAICKDAMGNQDGALRDYFDALDYEGIVDADYSTIHNNIAYIYVQKGNYSLAEKHIAEALKRSTLINYIWSTDGELAYLRSEYSRCLSSMNNAITIGGNDTISLYFRGMAKEKLGDTWGAYRDLEDAKTLGCKRADLELSKIDISNAVRREHQRQVVSWPHTRGNIEEVLVKTIILDESYTAITIQISNNEGYRSTRYGISSKTYIKVGEHGTPVPLIHTQNCPIRPKTTTLDAHSLTEFVLYFPAIEVSSHSNIILTEVDENGTEGWGFSIKLKEGTLDQAVKNSGKNVFLGLRGVGGSFSGEKEGQQYTDYWGNTSKTVLFDFGYGGGRLDLTFGKNGGVGLSVPFYFMNGQLTSGASILLGGYGVGDMECFNHILDAGVLYNKEIGTTFSFGYGIGVGPIIFNFELLYSPKTDGLGLGGGITFLFFRSYPSLVSLKLFNI